jgi:hypothetical protein
MKVPLNVVVCSLGLVKRLLGVQNDSSGMNTQGTLDSPAMKTPGGFDLPVLNTLGSVDSPAMNTVHQGVNFLVNLKQALEKIYKKNFWLQTVQGQESKDSPQY